MKIKSASAQTYIENFFLLEASNNLQTERPENQHLQTC